MIKNERQYRITKAQAERFASALHNLRQRIHSEKDLDPLLLKVQEDALRSQLADLEDELREYESLKAGNFRIDELKAVSELPKVLIKARIASGLTQKDLADRLGLQEQQIQRYEATEYASASLGRIREVIKALGVDERLLPSSGDASLQALLRRLAEAGLSKDFVLKRMVPRRLAMAGTPQDEQGGGSSLTHLAATTIGRIFGWSPAQLLSGETLPLEPALGAVRFKLAATAEPRRVSAYTVYAHYLSLLVTETCSQLPSKTVPTDPFKFRDDVIASYGSLSLEGIVRHTWDLGIPVLGLDDPSAFHGACFREEGRNVIVLKQRTSSESRWTFDLLHEIWHAAQEPDKAKRTVLEADEMSEERRTSEEERTAGRFAGAVLLAGRGQVLADRCLLEANKNLRLLKGIVQRVAARESVPVDVLANYLAFRLAVEQGRDWWGTATNLQVMGNPWIVVRDVFFERATFSKLADPDREILAQALTPWDEVANV